MALAALLSMLGVTTEAEGIQLVQSFNTFLSDVRTATGATDQPSALRAVQASSALLRQLETGTGKQGQEAINAALAWKGQAEQATALATQVATLEAEKATGARDAYIAQLSTEGKLPPSLHPWAKTQTKAQLELYAASATVVPPAAGGDGNPPPAPPAGQTSVTTLTAEEIEVCKHLNLTPEVFLERKKFEADNPTNPFATNTAGGKAQ